MVWCAEILTTSPLLAPLCSLSPPKRAAAVRGQKTKRCGSSPTKARALCPVVGEASQCLTRERDGSRVIFHLCSLSRWRWSSPSLIRLIFLTVRCTVLRVHMSPTSTGKKKKKSCRTIPHSCIGRIKPNSVLWKTPLAAVVPAHARVHVRGSLRQQFTVKYFFFLLFHSQTRSPYSLENLRSQSSQPPPPLPPPPFSSEITGGFQRGHRAAVWIIDFNWFNLVLKWAKTQGLSLPRGSERGAWSSTHL